MNFLLIINCHKDNCNNNYFTEMIVIIFTKSNIILIVENNIL